MDFNCDWCACYLEYCELFVRVDIVDSENVRGVTLCRECAWELDNVYRSRGEEIVL